MKVNRQLHQFNNLLISYLNYPGVITYDKIVEILNWIRKDELEDAISKVMSKYAEVYFQESKNCMLTFKK